MIIGINKLINAHKKQKTKKQTLNEIRICMYNVK